LEKGKQEKEICELTNVKTWTEKGWTSLYRVIRHALAPHKKIIRVLTRTGLVDVTDDHSLINKFGTEISPKNVQTGTELLHYPLTEPISSPNQVTQLNSVYNLITSFSSMTKASHFINYLNEHCISYYFHSECGEPYLCIGEKNYNANKVIHMTEIPYEGYVYDLTTENHHFAAGIGNLIVHNTDSIFFTFNLQAPDGTPIRGERALEITIELAKHAGHLASSFLKGPHDLEYEKTFMPFCLLSKKRYVGMLYEDDYKKGKRKEMGIVLKRRDNAPIVKDIYGGIIDILMKEQNIQKAVQFLHKSLDDIVCERTPLEKLIITKSLGSSYKNPNQIAHR
jgi:hypothetical protein